MFLANGLLDLQISGLASKFDTFRQNIELTDVQKEKIVISHNALRATIEKLPYVSKTFLTGSYLKQTMIKPPNDVDIFVVLTGSQANLLPQSVLDKLKNDIFKTYSTSTVRQDRPCVVVDMAHCKFELTPAFLQRNYVGDIYNIPQNNNTGLTWGSIQNPNDLARQLSEKNRILNGKLVPLIKMMKKCKINNPKRNDIKSFQMEEVAIKTLSYIGSYSLEFKSF